MHVGQEYQQQTQGCILFCPSYQKVLHMVCPISGPTNFDNLVKLFYAQNLHRTHYGGVHLIAMLIFHFSSKFDLIFDFNSH